MRRKDRDTSACKRAWIALLVLTLPGCTTINANLNTGYQPYAAAVRQAPVPDALAVQRFADERPARVYSTAGRIFLTYIPFVPYAALPFERIDESAVKAGNEAHLEMPPFSEFAYPVSMARAIADDLGTSGIFTSVKYVDQGPTDGYRYVLSGVLRASPVETDATSYGLGIIGVYFWLLPIPVGKTWTSITLDLKLSDTANGTVVWQRTVSHEYSKWMTLYTSFPGLTYGGESSFGFVQLPRSAQVDRESLFSWNFEVLRQAMSPVPAEIAAALVQRP